MTSEIKTHVITVSLECDYQEDNQGHTLRCMNMTVTRDTKGEAELVLRRMLRAKSKAERVRPWVPY